jgi:aspartate carbamoyltransferase catalytic subunit
VPVLNAGDGKGQHPTQALLDLYTIKDELGRVDGVRVAIAGDLANGRTARSLAYLLSKYRDVEVWFVAPAQVQMGQDIKDYLHRHEVPWHETHDLDEVLPKVDVVYQTRIQKERFADEAAYQAVRGIYVVDTDTMARLSPYAIVMHPLPRVDEIDPEVDCDPRAAYFRQARNGVQIRMALLEMVLS